MTSIYVWRCVFNRISFSECIMFVVVEAQTAERHARTRTYEQELFASPRIKFWPSPLFRAVTRDISSFSDLAVALTLHHRVTRKNRGQRKGRQRGSVLVFAESCTLKLSEFLTGFSAPKFRFGVPFSSGVTGFSRRIFATGQPALGGSTFPCRLKDILLSESVPAICRRAYKSTSATKTRIWFDVAFFRRIYTYAVRRKFQTESRTTCILYSRQMLRSRHAFHSLHSSAWRARNAELSLFSWQKESVYVAGAPRDFTRGFVYIPGLLRPDPAALKPVQGNSRGNIRRLGIIRSRRRKSFFFFRLYACKICVDRSWRENIPFGRQQVFYAHILQVLFVLYRIIWNSDLRGERDYRKNSSRI